MHKVNILNFLIEFFLLDQQYLIKSVYYSVFKHVLRPQPAGYNNTRIQTNSSNNDTRSGGGGCGCSCGSSYPALCMGCIHKERPYETMYVKNVFREMHFCFEP